MSTILKIKNDGADIARTTYFDTPHAAQGLYFLSWHAPVARLLVPDHQLTSLDEMRTARLCIISRGRLDGRDAFELLFEDDSDNPFVIHIDARQSDRMVSLDVGAFTVAAWTRRGKAAEWPGRYRQVPRLPCLAACVVH